MRRLPYRLHHLLQAARAVTVVRPGPRLVVAELATHRTNRYRLRDGGFFVTLRHCTRDIEILNEIFSHHTYRPPEAAEHALTAGALRVLDLGGNIGLFGVWAATRWPIACIDSYEPDPANFAVLSDVVAANSRIEWRTHRSAVSNRSGVMTFVCDAFSESHSAGAEESGIAVRVADLFALDHRVDLLKIDIEGDEWPILLDPRIAELGARVIVMEWHRRGAPEHRDAHNVVLNRLSHAGYRIVAAERHRTTGGVWAIRDPSRQ